MATVRLEAVSRADEEVRIAVVVTPYDHDELTIRHERRLYRRAAGFPGSAILDTTPLFFRRCEWRLSESGEDGIRTHGGVSPTQHFQCCTFGRSVTSPTLIFPIFP